MKEEEREDLLYQPQIESKKLVAKKLKKKSFLKTVSVFTSDFCVFKKIVIKNKKSSKDIFVVPKKVGIAVKRNYIKRVLRSLFYSSRKKDFFGGFSYLVIIHKRYSGLINYNLILKNFLCFLKTVNLF